METTVPCFRKVTEPGVMMTLPAIPALRKLKQEDFEFKASPGPV